MRAILSSQGLTITLTTDGDSHSLYSERDDLWQKLKWAVRDTHTECVKEWKDADVYHNLSNNKHGT